jgi:cyclase
MTRNHLPAVRTVLIASLTLVAAAAPALAQLQTMEVTKLADGVYGAIYSEMVRDPVQSNSLIIIGDDGVCVVDAHYTPSAARATIAEIRKLTPLPVRFVVTTHWHDDHIFGNQEYRAAFPGVQFVAHQEVRTSMVAKALEHQQSLVKSYSAAIPRAETRLASGLGRDGKPLTADERADLVFMLPIYRAYLEDFSAVTIVLPTITFDKEITLRLGSREVQVRSFGAGNTKGDAVIYLPKDRIVAVGDLVVYPVPFIYGGFPASWVEVMRAVRELRPETIVPGHGPVMRDFAYFDRVTALMQSMAGQAKAAVARGLTLEETRKAFDLAAFRDQFIQGKEAREGTFTASIINSGIEAAYTEAKSAAEKTKG